MVGRFQHRGLMGSGSMKLIVLLVLFFIISSLTFYLIISSMINKRIIKQRMDDHIPIGKKREDNVEEKKSKSSKKLISPIAKVFQSIQFSKKTKKLLLEAGSPLKLEEYFAYRILCAFTLAIITILIGMHIIVSILAVIVGFMIPKLYVSRKRKNRLNQLPHQLIDALGLMSSSLRAGFSFIQVMQLVGKEMPDPIGSEFELAVREAGLGVPMEEVFEDMIKRMPSKELEVALQAIIAQRKSGGNLAELLDTMEETIRGRVRVLGELKTLTAQGKMSSWIITLLPVGLAAYLYFISPDYFTPMLHHPLGIIMILVAVFFVIFGWFVIQKILQIEV